MHAVQEFGVVRDRGECHVLGLGGRFDVAIDLNGQRIGGTGERGAQAPGCNGNRDQGEAADHGRFSKKA